MKKFFAFALASCALLLAGCVDNVPQEEELPSAAVSFEYMIEGDYALDFYIDSDITFRNTSPTEGMAVWDFGDKKEVGTIGDEVKHSYDVAGTYTVRLTIEQPNGETLFTERVIMIVDIKPLLTINPIEGGLCQVLSSRVDFTVELPNPKNRVAEYEWVFPDGTVDEAGEALTSCSEQLPGKIGFSNVGSQTVRLRVKLDGRQLEDASINVQVAYNEPVPTLYYTTIGGNIMALKLVGEPQEGMHISPFDMGVSSGQHPFNLLFNDSLLYILDAGAQFYYVDDADGVLGDGKISIMAKDGSKVETMISNVGQAAFDDPFFGCIDGDKLYYTNRNTGIVAVPLKTRNAMYSKSEFPYFVDHNTLNYYNHGFSYGAISACIGKVGTVWHWCKTYNGYGIFRFEESDILPAYVAEGDAKNLPAAGIALESMRPKSFAYDKKNDKFYFTLWDEGFGGFYACTMAELNSITKKADLAQYKKLSVDGAGFEPNTSGSPASQEGTGSEVVGVTQLALDEATGCVYFGFRPAAADVTSAPTGLYRYNPSLDKIECVIEGVKVYGLVVNNTPSKLF